MTDGHCTVITGFIEPDSVWGSEQWPEGRPELGGSRLLGMTEHSFGLVLNPKW